MPPNGKKFVHPNARPDLILKSEQEVRDKFPQVADAYLTPMPIPGAPGYWYANNGADSTPVQVEIIEGFITEPDGITIRNVGDKTIMPFYLADDWRKMGRLKIIG